MLYLCKLITDRSGMKGIRIFECRGLDSLVVIPEEIKGQPVIELAPYIFSAQEDYEPEDRSDAFWWGEGGAGGAFYCQRKCPDGAKASQNLKKGRRLRLL